LQTITNGEITWYKYEKPLSILEAEDINRIYKNMVTIHNLFAEKGYILEDLKVISASVNTPYNKIFDILSNIEYNIDVLNSSQIKSDYYISSKTIGEYAPNTKDIWRWIQVLNELYGILIGEIKIWGYLLCTNGYPVINGNRILIRGDING
jgi:hypothetical protein